MGTHLIVLNRELHRFQKSLRSFVWTKVALALKGFMSAQGSSCTMERRLIRTTSLKEQLADPHEGIFFSHTYDSSTTDGTTAKLLDVGTTAKGQQQALAPEADLRKCADMIYK